MHSRLSRRGFIKAGAASAAASRAGIEGRGLARPMSSAIGILTGRSPSLGTLSSLARLMLGWFLKENLKWDVVQG